VVLDLDAAAHPGLADESSLEQALMNLVLNARDAISEEGTVTITTRNVALAADAIRRGLPGEGDYVMVEVADSGQGIPPEVVSRIFDPFFTTKPVGKGTGLGLTMVYAFVQQCGGGIEVASEVGKGTTFRLYFRRAEPARMERRAGALAQALLAPAASPVADANRKQILVVDDDPSIRELTRLLLQESGYKVLTASGPAGALNLMKAEGQKISLVIVDLVMPDMSGTELGQRLADLRLPAKVLFVSGYGSDALEDVPGLAEHGVLQKPFTRSDLLGRVKGLLDS
jgi:two-component system, cell cycle sensor histidine kinase and response regulator CckA